MFGRNPYLIPPSAAPSRGPSAADLDGVEILLHHHHHHQYQHHHHHHPDAFPGLYLAHAHAHAHAPAADDGGAVFENGEASASASAAPARKQTVKKDRHSKIHTAQGPRDRRVRLSIGIARKFFDLQEMLGFDKPSKTLDWLLTKSKAAIKELVQTSSSNSPSACEMISSENGAEYSNRRKDKAAAASVAKESRAKARARARERTLEKMCIKQLGGDRCDASDLNASSFQCRNNQQQLEFLQLSAGSGSATFRDPVYRFPVSGEAAAPPGPVQGPGEESVVIKRKNKVINSNPSSLLGFQQNLVLNSNYMIPSANENWDVFGQSNLHAAFDHHKFFNSSSNI